MTTLTTIPQLTIADTVINMVDGLYSLNDLHKASGGEKKHQPAFFMRNKETQELASEINRSANMMNGNKTIAFKRIKGGNNKLKQGTYVCKELVYRYAMWISPKFALIVIRTFDALVNNQTPKQIEQISTINDRKPLVDAVNTYCAKSGAIYSDVWKMIHQRFGVTKVDQLTIEQIPHAVEYIHNLTLVYEPTNDNLPAFEYLTTAKHEALEYVWELQRRITKLGGELPAFPNIDKEQLAQSFITRLLMNNRVMLSFGSDGAPSMRFVPTEHYVVSPNNIDEVVETIDKRQLPSIIETAVKRLAR